jgi:hypothetical protein
MSYGPDIPDIFRRAAGYLDCILKGTSPAMLPGSSPPSLNLLNQKVAGTLGLSLPSTHSPQNQAVREQDSAGIPSRAASKANPKEE